MNVGEWITVPTFIGTKGGGKKKVGTHEAKVIYIGPKFITVDNGRYLETFTHQQLRAQDQEVVD